MRPRPILVSGAAVLISVLVVALEAPPAAAASCGNGQGGALLLGCDNNTATDDTWILGSSTSGSGLVVNETGANSNGVVGQAVETGAFGTGGTMALRALPVPAPASTGTRSPQTRTASTATPTTQAEAGYTARTTAPGTGWPGAPAAASEPSTTAPTA